MLKVRSTHLQLTLALAFRIYQGMAIYDICFAVLGGDVANDWRRGWVNVDKRRQDELEKQMKAKSDKEKKDRIEDDDEAEEVAVPLQRSQARLQEALATRHHLRLALALPAQERHKIHMETERRGNNAWWMAREALRALLMGGDDDPA